MGRIKKAFFPENRFYLTVCILYTFICATIPIAILVGAPSIGVPIASIVAVKLVLGVSRLMAEWLDLKRYLINWLFGC